MQNKLVTVSPDTKVLRAMELMTGIDTKTLIVFGPECWDNWESPTLHINCLLCLACFDRSWNSSFDRIWNFGYCADNRIRHIPVVENKEMKGMVSIGDVVRAVVDEHREELQRLSSYIQGGY